MGDTVFRQFAKKVRAARAEMKISLGTLSDMTGLARQSLARIEQGEGEIFFGSALKVAFALGFEIGIQDFETILEKTVHRDAPRRCRGRPRKN